MVKKNGLQYGKKDSYITMDNPQPSSYGRYGKTMEKVQRLDGSGLEKF
jgi:hypothetical protein